MGAVVHYLLVYSYGDQSLVSERTFATSVEAMEAYRAAEENYRGRSDQFEVVLLGASSREALAKTHGRYFAEPSRRDPFRDLVTQP